MNTTMKQIIDCFQGIPVMIAMDRSKSAIVQPNESKNFLKGIPGFNDFYISDLAFKNLQRSVVLERCGKGVFIIRRETLSVG